MIQIRHFENRDIQQAEKIADRVWGDLYTNQSDTLQTFIYKFMVEYYDLNRNFSFCAIEKDLKGFLLAAKKSDKNTSAEIFKEKIKSLTKEEQKTAVELLNYLNVCGETVKSLMKDDDVMLGLFVSTQKGCGKMLLAKLNDTCYQNGIKNIYLWTDTTCDHNYYDKNNFVLVKEAVNNVNGKNINTIIYKKEVIKP